MQTSKCRLLVLFRRHIQLDMASFIGYSNDLKTLLCRLTKVDEFGAEWPWHRRALKTLQSTIEVSRG